VCDTDLRPSTAPSLTVNRWVPNSEGPELVQMFCNEEHLAIWANVSMERDEDSGSHLN